MIAVYCCSPGELNPAWAPSVVFRFALLFFSEAESLRCLSAVSMVEHNQFMLFRTASHNVHVVIADVSSFFAAP